MANQYSQIPKEILIQATYDVLRNTIVPDVLKKDFLKNCTIQIWSENFQGNIGSKFIGNRLMSEGAYQHYMKNKTTAGLHHEHVMTKNLIYNHHFSKRYLEVELDEIEEWMNECAFGCLITLEENKQYLGKRLKQNMPTEFYTPRDPWYRKKWARYLKSGFTDIWIVEWDKNKIPHKIKIPDFDETFKLEI